MITLQSYLVYCGIFAGIIPLVSTSTLYQKRERTHGT